MQHDGHSDEKRSFFASRANIVLVGFLALAAFYLIAEHRAHLWLALPWLPWLLLLACPLMHFFMHGGHGGHGGDDNAPRGAPDDRRSWPHQH